MRLILKSLVRSRPFISERFQQRWLGTTCRRLQEVAESGSGGSSSGYLREAYHCNQEWNKRLETPLLKKIQIEDFFYDIDKRYQADKVISAIDVDLFVNRVTDDEHLDELEELVHWLRRSPATADSLPSTSYALIRAFMNAEKYEDLMRILNDRWNYGVFVDHHIANILMDEFLKRGNNRDAAKVASLLMLEEDFGSPTSGYFALLSCLKYLKEPSPEPWMTEPPKDESEEETKVRVEFVRNPHFDDHFDLCDPNHVVGKTLTLVSQHLEDDQILNRSARLIGLALHGKWDKVELALQYSAKNKKPVAEEAIAKCSELCDKALADIEASPTKTLPKPKVHQYPGVNLDEKDVTEMWTLINYPEYEKFVPKVKALLTSNQIPLKQLNMVETTEKLLSTALAEREDKEIQEQLKAFQEWDERRATELNNQLKRFKTYEVMESVDQRKKDLKEKEEVIFFFDNEEEWMMRLPPDEQQGYKLPTDYTPLNYTHFVRHVPPKKEKRKKKPTT